MKKISKNQFILDCFNKMFELVGSGLCWSNFEELKDWCDKTEAYYNMYTFSPKQYLDFKKYFFDHITDYLPKYKTSRRGYVEDLLGSFMLQYGFCREADLNEIREIQ